MHFISLYRSFYLCDLWWEYIFIHPVINHYHICFLSHFYTLRHSFIIGSKFDVCVLISLSVVRVCGQLSPAPPSCWNKNTPPSTATYCSLDFNFTTIPFSKIPFSLTWHNALRPKLKHFVLKNTCFYII